MSLSVILCLFIVSQMAGLPFVLGLNLTCVCGSPVDGHSACFHVLALVTNAALNVGCKCLFETMVVSFRYVRGSGIAGSHGGYF